MDNETTATPATFAQALSAHLASRSLSQRHLAMMMGVTEGMVSQYLTGKRQPGVPLIQRIADALEARAEYRPSLGWAFEY